MRNCSFACTGFSAALGEAGQLLRGDGDNPLFVRLKAAILAAIGEDEQALALFRTVGPRESGLCGFVDHIRRRASRDRQA